MKILIGAIIAVIAIGGLVAIYIKNSENKSDVSTTTVGSSQTSDLDVATTQESDQKPLTSEEVAKHNTNTDCWTIIEGEVYDLTTFISGHPGGSEILRACGNDATTYFRNRETPDGQEIGSGTPHSSSAENILNDLKLGKLVN